MAAWLVMLFGANGDVMNKRWFVIVLLAALTLPAAAQAESVTLRTAATTNLTTVDPQLAADKSALDVVENLFLGLTDLDPQTGAVRPELATRWEVSGDGLEYYFFLRSDVSWVRWNPVTQQAEALRAVVAGDVVNAVRRACDPRTGAPNAHVLGGLIAGCGEALRTPSDHLNDDVFNAIGVQALDNTTVVFQLSQASAHFPAVAAMPVLYPVPQEVIDRHEAAWIEPGNLVTNGPYALHEHVRYVRRVLASNPLLPADLRGPGNVERWVTDIVPDQATALAQYQAGEIDAVTLPLDAAQADYPGSVHAVTTLRSVYVGFAHDKPPFDNPAVRRAFSAALDRAAFAQSVYLSAPMSHFTPPGVSGAPQSGDIGVGYNPDYAREQLAQAGYPGCQGIIGPVELAAALPAEQVEFLLEAWETVLGCPAELFNVTNADLATLRGLVEVDATRPHLWTGVHVPDYPALYAWLGEALYCEAAPDTRRVCTAADDLIARLRWLVDAGERAELVQQVEAAFFGAEGEMPVAPWYAVVSVRAYQPWYSAPVDTDGLFGGFHLDWVTLSAP
jgi:oligopeptide transport system substrate-binding protein